MCPVTGLISPPRGSCNCVWVARMLTFSMVRDSALWASCPTSSSWYTTILSGVSVISSVVGLGKENVGVEGLVPRKGPACDGGEDSDPPSSPSSLLIVSGACSRLVISSGSRVLRGIFSCRLSAAILNAIQLFSSLFLLILTQAKCSELNSTGIRRGLCVEQA